VSEAYYIGDEVRDIAAAAHAGIRSIAVSWGYSDRETLAAERPDHLVDAPEELVRIIAPRSDREIA
jgi:phosphoglycolate phosphatase